MKVSAYVTVPMILLFAGGLLVVVGTLLSTLRTNKEKLDSARQRVEFETTLREKSDQIAQMSLELKNYATGGDTFAYAIPSLPVSPTDPITLMLGKEGQYPLYDVRIRVRDHSQAMPFSQISKEIDAHTLSRAALDVGEAQFEIGSIGQGQAPSFGSWRPDSKGHLSLSLWIYARNGTISERLGLQRTNNKWLLAIRATRETDNSVVFESVDPQYPKDKNGKILW